MLPVKADALQSSSGLCIGARRSFFCRMKCKSVFSAKQNVTITSSSQRRKKKSNSDKKYIVVHCTGYLKSWAHLSCLVAIGRILPKVFHPNIVPPVDPNIRKTHFLSRHTVDGKFLFIDQR